MKKISKIFFRVVFSRTMITLVLLLLQAAILFLNFAIFRRLSAYFVSGYVLFSLIVLLYLLNKEDIPEFKLVWVIPICVFPVFGSLLFLFVDRNFGTRGVRKALKKIIRDTACYVERQPEVLAELQKENPQVGNLAYYADTVGDYPTYKNCSVKYFPFGENKWEDMLEELKQAQEFIFMEYFIVEPGIMWNSVLEILKEKAAAGVKVYLMFDGTCSLFLLPYNYPKQLGKFGIHAKYFSKIVPVLSTHQNNRDHRKILVIDGKTAYTGGVNLADEYINKKEKFGRWKDTAVKIKGPAVDSFARMFMRMWNLDGKESLDFGTHLGKYEKQEAEGYVMPYADGPDRRENMAEKIYMDMMNTAEKTLSIMTPYFIVDNALLNALKYTAQRGVKVTMLLPHIPDKRFAFAIARTYYKTLMRAGVHIYEYTPGFVHAKMFLADGKKAIVGTINLDYRSLYHHYECAAFFYKHPVIGEIAADFENTIAQSQAVTYEYYKKINPLWRIIGYVLNLFAPLM